MIEIFGQCILSPIHGMKGSFYYLTFEKSNNAQKGKKCSGGFIWSSRRSIIWSRDCWLSVSNFFLQFLCSENFKRVFLETTFLHRLLIKFPKLLNRSLWNFYMFLTPIPRALTDKTLKFLIFFLCRQIVKKTHLCLKNVCHYFIYLHIFKIAIRTLASVILNPKLCEFFVLGGPSPVFHQQPQNTYFLRSHAYLLFLCRKMY